MALPGGRAITVDGKGYQWIVKKDKRASRDSSDDLDGDYPIYDRVLTIKADAGGPVMQHKMADTAVTPKEVEAIIRADVARGHLKCPVCKLEPKPKVRA